MSNRTAFSLPLPPSSSVSFLAGGGEMGERIRAHDWTRTSLGAPDIWPAPLRTVVRILLTTNHPVFVFWGPELVCLYNDAYSRSLGPEKHPSMLGDRGRAAWDEIWPIIGPQIEQVMAGGGATWHENHLVPITRNGRLEEVYWTYSYGPIDDETAPSCVGGVLVLCTETTAQVRAELQLRAAEAGWRALFDQAPSFVCVLRGPEHRFEYANPRYLELVAKHGIVGKTVLELLPEVEEQGFIALLDRVYRTGEPYVASAAPVVLARAGDIPPVQRYLDFVYQPIRDPEGRVTGIFVEGLDVSERKQAEEALREADRRKDDFLAILSHELRNPLAPIRNAARILRTSASDTKLREWAAMVIDRQVQTMAHLLDDLLDTSRITRGTLAISQQRVTLESVVDAALEVARPLIEARRQTLSMALPAEPVELDADALRLSQALSNLMTNAAKYTDPGGSIALSARTAGGSLYIALKDSGIGLAQDSLARIFEMFSQVGSARDRSEGGLGIGLALVKGIVELHGGRIEAHSEGLGRGSEFRIWLPLSAATDKKATAGTPRASAAATAPRRILVADDNHDGAQTLALLLQLSGHDVRIARDGPAALALAREFRPQVALLDIGMPELDGYEVAAALRAEPWSTGLKLVALTGWGQEQDKRRAEAAGFDRHVTKPVDPAEVEGLL